VHHVINEVEPDGLLGREPDLGADLRQLEFPVQHTGRAEGAEDQLRRRSVHRHGVGRWRPCLPADEVRTVSGGCGGEAAMLRSHVREQLSKGPVAAGRGPAQVRELSP
jgi:hypothetical protein